MGISVEEGGSADLYVLDTDYIRSMFFAPLLQVNDHHLVGENVDP